MNPINNLNLQPLSHSMRSFAKGLVILLVISFGILQTSCNTPKHNISRVYRKMNITERQMADSIIAYALDHEALYTLCDTLKPMSSVQFYRMPLLSTNILQRDSAQRVIGQIQKVVNQLSMGDYRFVLNPFERTDSIYRNMEIYVFRKSRLQNTINTHQEFYSKWGITAIADPASVLAITEYENKYDRWRSYGYLFGYPDYAVDFFVAAGQLQDSTTAFVKRDFFQIPVYVATSGHFTYAVPKDYQPTQTDSLIYNKAKTTLDKYKNTRAKYYQRKNSPPIKLWARLIK